MTQATAPGRAFVFGDNIDTDVLAPGLYMKKPIQELARHCLEAVDPAFATTVRPGDIVVGGENFGLGSSREQAAEALRHLGVTIILAKSFAGLFFRNCINLGVAPIELEDTSRIKPGDLLAVDPITGTIENRTQNQTYKGVAIPAHLVEMVRDGGLIPHLERRARAGTLGKGAA
ncbi:MAG TPA: 3-isopropylmalate dehydratase [Alphaproteobacteria bacterium]|nr:3-isopropylmalate dehydratase [Alphaproteobacteria bacterium]